jgi:hypothetical protein
MGQARGDGGVRRLADVAVDARTVAVEQVLHLLRRGQDNHGQEPRPPVGPQAPQDLQPVYLGQLEIEQYQLRHDAGVPRRVLAGGEQVVQGLGAVAGNNHLARDVVLS